MKNAPQRSAGPRYTLDRITAVPAIIGEHRDFLFIGGLAGTARDLAALTRDGAHCYALAGAMGAAVMMGLGLALARPDRKILVATGDGELLMNVGALATVGILNPPNLSILCARARRPANALDPDSLVRRIGSGLSVEPGHLAAGMMQSDDLPIGTERGTP